MAGIGIIANPSSGKDIRRLVSFATTINNHEKANICKRIVLAAQEYGVDTVYMMPDAFGIATRVIESLKLEDMLKCSIKILEMILKNDATDSERAAMAMETIGLKCIVVLGGDGTSRAVARGIKNTPIIPVSTGTNNVYPQLTEGTVVGLAAAAVSCMKGAHDYYVRDKIIEVKKNGKTVDLALIDAVVANDLWSGSKAVWKTEKISKIFVTRCHPASIGFSAVAGCTNVILPSDDKGLFVELGETGERYKVPIAAGVIEEVNVKESRELILDEPVHILVEDGIMIALDGEREVYGAPGDTMTFTIKRNGPMRVRQNELLRAAVDMEFFKVMQKL